MVKKPSLKELIEKTEWIKIPYKTHKKKLLHDEIAITITDYKKTDDKIKLIKVRFGSDVLKTINVDQNSRLAIMLDPDDLLNVLVVKTDNGGSRPVRKEKVTGINYLSFRWDQPVPLTDQSSVRVSYDTYKHYLNFRIPQ